jgi:hypothetical protein
MALPLSNQPRDLKLGPDNDLVFTPTGPLWVTGIDAVAQSCRIAVQMFKGEWFADLTLGVGYFADADGNPGILGAKPAAAIARARNDYYRVLSAVDGVLAVKRLDVTVEGRTLVVKWVVTTASGDTVLDEIRKNTP